MLQNQLHNRKQENHNNISYYLAHESLFLNDNQFHFNNIAFHFLRNTISGIPWFQ